MKVLGMSLLLWMMIVMMMVRKLIHNKSTVRFFRNTPLKRLIHYSEIKPCGVRWRSQLIWLGCYWIRMEKHWRSFRNYSGAFIEIPRYPGVANVPATTPFMVGGNLSNIDKAMGYTLAAGVMKEMQIPYKKLIGVTDIDEKDEIVKSVMELRQSEAEDGYSMEVIVSRSGKVQETRTGYHTTN